MGMRKTSAMIEWRSGLDGSSGLISALMHYDVMVYSSSVPLFLSLSLSLCVCVCLSLSLSVTLYVSLCRSLCNDIDEAIIVGRLEYELHD